MSAEVLLRFIEELGFSYQTYEHDPVFTTEDGNHLHATISGAHTKNLFLKDKKKSFFLVSVLDHKRVDLKLLSKTVGKGGLSFGNPDELKNKLNVVPGSVTPYGLIFDKPAQVHFILDRDFLAAETVNFHPLRNNMTINMTVKQFLDFMKKIHHSPEIIEIPILN